MTQELSGKIIELIDNNNGVILGENNKKYFFTKMDFLVNFTPEINQKVMFKPEIIRTSNGFLYKALLISND